MTRSRHTSDGGGPHLAFFEVDGRRELGRRLAAARPGARARRESSWVKPPRARRGRVGVWYWGADHQELMRRAPEVLRRFVLPLVAGGAPYCVGFPFPAEALERRPLGFADGAALDLEDIGTLLRPGPAGGGVGPAGNGVGPAAQAGAAAAAEPRLDEHQAAAVGHVCGPARVLAGAGAGKTKTLISRVAELVARGVPPGAILMLAFNREAAEQLEERLAALGIATTRRIGADPPDGRSGTWAGGPRSPGGGHAATHSGGRRGSGGAVHCATFNAFGYRYQREVAGARFELDSGGGAARDLMRRALDAAGYGPGVLKPARGSDPAGACLAALTRVRAALEAPAGITVDVLSCGEEPLVRVPFAEVHAEFTRLQARDGRQSFDDQIYLAVADLLAEPRHRAFIQARYRHVLVDEFQDLNGSQLALVDILSRPRRDLFAVGDDDQLIYGWRYADSTGILDFHERMPPKPWSATYTLRTNYRCSRAVVEASSRLIAHNSRREHKDVSPRNGAAPGEVRAFGAETWAERAGEACAFLRTERARLACEWRALAVLCRYRALQLPVALALDREGIPRAAVLDCRLFSDPAARLLRACIEQVRAPGRLSDADRRLLDKRPARFVRAADAAAAAEALRRELPQLTPAELVCAVTDEFGLGDHWGAVEDARARGAGAGTAGGPAASSAGGAAATRPARGATLPAAAAAAAPGTGPAAGPAAGPFQILEALLLLADGHTDVAAYLAEWDRLRADEEATPAGPPGTGAGPAPDRVVIGTIHAAKGREYRSVVIPEYWVDLSRLPAAELEEERRVLYVGVTRAQESALITYDSAQPERHPFLRELLDDDGGGGAGRVIPGSLSVSHRLPPAS